MQAKVLGEEVVDLQGNQLGVLHPAGVCIRAKHHALRACSRKEAVEQQTAMRVVVRAQLRQASQEQDSHSKLS